jgi:hypothetical protein
MASHIQVARPAVGVAKSAMGYLLSSFSSFSSFFVLPPDHPKKSSVLVLHKFFAILLL